MSVFRRLIHSPVPVFALLALTAAVADLTGDGWLKLSYEFNNQEPKKRLYEELKSILGHIGMHPDHLIPRHAYMKTEIPLAEIGTDPARTQSWTREAADAANEKVVHGLEIGRAHV